MNRYRRLLGARKSSLVFLMPILFLLTACTGENPTPTSTDDSQPEKTYLFKYNSYISPSDYEWEPKNKSMEQLVKDIGEQTDGRVKIDLFYNNQLAGQTESLDALSRGTFAFQNISPGIWSDKIPESAFTSLPFWTMSEAHAYYILRETEVGELLKEALEEYGIKPLMFWPSGITGYMSAKKPIVSPDDLKGLILNNTSELTADYYKSFGAGLSNIPAVEYYEGLLRGTFDAVPFPFSGLESIKLHEVVNYITLPATANPTIAMVAMNKSVWEDLPTDLQETITKVVANLEDEAIQGSIQLSEKAMEYAEENDVEVVNMSEESYQQFLDGAKEKVWSKFAEKNDRTKKMVEVLTFETEKWLKDNPEEAEKFNAYFK